MSSSAGKISEPEPPRPFWRRAMRVFGVVLALVILLGIVVAGWIWSQRYQLIENAVIENLAERGLVAELDIRSMTRTHADIQNINVSDVDGPVLSVRNLKAEYDWREALEGRFIKIELLAPEIYLTLDEKGRPVAPWMPPADQSAPDRALIEIPPKGLFIQNGTFDLGSPYGQVSGQVDAKIEALDNFNVDANLETSTVTYGDFEGRISGPLQFRRMEGVDQFEAELHLDEWKYKDFSGSNTSLKAQGVADISPDQVQIDGRASATFDKTDIRLVTTGNGSAMWSGKVTLPRKPGQTIEMSGDWTADIRDVVMTDPARRQRLANALTLQKSLSQTPIAEHFSSDISQGMDQLLTKGDISGAGQISKTQTRTDVFFSAPLIWTSEKGQVELMSRGDDPDYAFDRKNRTLFLKFDAAFNYPKSVKMEQVELEMISDTGRDFEKVTAFSSRIKSPQTWYGRNEAGRKVRLAPFAVKVEYVNRDRRQLTMRGAVDYDGDIPGGFATGLIARGQLDVSFVDNMKIKFASYKNHPIKIDRFDTVTDWYAKNVIFNVPADQYFYTRFPNKTGRLATDLTAISTDLSRIDGSQSMHLIIDDGFVDARIRSSEQLWNFKGGSTQMTSDNMPSPGTEMNTEQFELDAVLQPGTPVEFELTSPKANVKTELVNARGLAVQASGSPEKIWVEYQNGWIKFLAAELPELPMTGDVIYHGNQWNGKATTYLEDAENTPIYVDYGFKDGAGTAKVDIIDLPFKPGGLQPQAFISALRGKVADVDGKVSAQIDLSFGADQPLQSSGRAQLMDISLGTLPGPMSGVNADLGFSSFFPLKSDGSQSLTMESFDPGFPLKQGEVTFEMVSDGVDISAARWPLGDGYISLAPSQWRYLADENRMILRVENVSLGEFFNQFGNDSLKATGRVNGELPIVISGINVEVAGGRLEVADGGVIQYVSPQTDAAAAQSQHAEMAFEALKDFRYERLELLMDGPLDGEITLKAEFLGSNPNVLYGSQFKFNVTMTGELLNIVRSFRIGPEILGKIRQDLENEGTALQP